MFLRNTFGEWVQEELAKKCLKMQRIFFIQRIVIITHIKPLLSFFTPWKHEKTVGFLMSSGGIKRDSDMKWHKANKRDFEMWIGKYLTCIFFLLYTGVIAICDIFEERGLVEILDMWGDPSSCYFPLFNNLPRLDVMHLHMVFLLMLVSAFFIMLGFLYRLACLTYMLTYWYIFFLDKTKWNNHSYLYGLLSVLFFFTNGNYYW